MDVIITGGTSFIGLAVIRKLLEEGDRVWAAVRPGSSNRGKLPVHDRLHTVELGLEDISRLPRLLPFPVRKYHIDTNEHVNNCQYVQMALEMIPGDMQVRQVRVDYKKSAVLGDMIFPKLSKEQERTVVELCDADGKPYAIVELK